MEIEYQMSGPLCRMLLDAILYDMFSSIDWIILISRVLFMEEQKGHYRLTCNYVMVWFNVF